MLLGAAIDRSSASLGRGSANQLTSGSAAGPGTTVAGAPAPAAHRQPTRRRAPTTAALAATTGAAPAPRRRRAGASTTPMALTGAAACCGCASHAGCGSAAKLTSTTGMRAAIIAYAAAGAWPRDSGAFEDDHSHGHDQDSKRRHAHGDGHADSSSSSSGGGCGAACDHDHSHDHPHNGHSHDHGHSHAHAHDHHHHHDHDHHEGHSHSHGGGACCGHGHSHGHTHEHFDAATEPSPLLRAVGRTGFFSLAEELEHGTKYSVASIVCYALGLALQAAAAAAALPPAAAAAGAALLCVTYFLSGVPQLAETLVACVRGRVDTHVLMSLSVVGTLYMGMAAEGALLLLLFRVSHLLEDKLTEKATGSLARLFDSVPSRATLVEVEPTTGAPRAAGATEVPAASVSLGQHVLVRPGEAVPLDGTITWGTANVSLQHISGESAPLRLGPGTSVPAGSVSTDGILVVRCEATADDSTPARIARMTAAAQAARPRLQRWLDAVGGVWSKAVIAATVLTAVLLPLMGVPFFGDRGALYRAMGVLTAGSPCALALVPLAYVCAIAAITARGVLVKSGAALDALAGVGTVALDKTGTITAGALTLAEGHVLSVSGGAGDGVAAAAAEPAAVDMRRMEGLDEMLLDGDLWFEQQQSGAPRAAAETAERAWAAAAGRSAAEAVAVAAAGGFDAAALSCAVALSRLSNHPVSRAVVEAAPLADARVEVLSFRQVPGSGVEGVCRVAGGEPLLVRFGALDWISGRIPEPASSAGSSQDAAEESAAAAPASGADGGNGLQLDSLRRRLQQHQGGRASRAVAFVTVGLYTGPADGSFHTDTQQQQQQGGCQRVAMLCFDDVVMPGVPDAVEALRSGSWAGPRWPFSQLSQLAGGKRVVMLTGDNRAVAESVASAVGISDFRAGLRPEDKLAYVQQAASEAEAAAASEAGGKGRNSSGGLMMVGDGINDAPALAAAQVGVAIAATPSDMVAAAADLIVLNGRGVTNLPWLFAVAGRTQTVLKQNLALSLVSVAVATLPTLAGLFPLWLAVTLHEGSTLLVALNSLRLLMEVPHGAPSRLGSPQPAAAARAAAAKAAAAAAAASPNGGKERVSLDASVVDGSSDSSSSFSSDQTGRRVSGSGSEASSSSAAAELPLRAGGGLTAAALCVPLRRRGRSHSHHDCGTCAPFCAAPVGRKGAACSHCHRAI